MKIKEVKNEEKYGGFIVNSNNVNFNIYVIDSEFYCNEFAYDMFFKDKINSFYNTKLIKLDQNEVEYLKTFEDSYLSISNNFFSIKKMDYYFKVEEVDPKNDDKLSKENNNYYYKKPLYDIIEDLDVYLNFDKYYSKKIDHYLNKSKSKIVSLKVGVYKDRGDIYVSKKAYKYLSGKDAIEDYVKISENDLKRFKNSIYKSSDGRDINIDFHEIDSDLEENITIHEINVYSNCNLTYIPSRHYEYLTGIKVDDPYVPFNLDDVERVKKDIYIYTETRKIIKLQFNDYGYFDFVSSLKK